MVIPVIVVVLVLLVLQVLPMVLQVLPMVLRLLLMVVLLPPMVLVLVMLVEVQELNKKLLIPVTLFLLLPIRHHNVLMVVRTFYVVILTQIVILEFVSSVKKPMLYFITHVRMHIAWK